MVREPKYDLKVYDALDPNHCGSMIHSAKTATLHFNDNEMIGFDMMSVNNMYVGSHNFPSLSGTGRQRRGKQLTTLTSSEWRGRNQSDTPAMKTF